MTTLDVSLPRPVNSTFVEMTFHPSLAHFYLQKAMYVIGLHDDVLEYLHMSAFYPSLSFLPWTAKEYGRLAVVQSFCLPWEPRRYAGRPF
jgi:hypothetical protein